MGLEKIINGMKKAACIGLTTIALMGGIVREARAKTYYAAPEQSIQSVINDPNIRVDFNHDYFVDFQDFSIIADDWRKTGYGLKGDVNVDGEVDYADLEILARNWLKPNSKIVFGSERDGNHEIYIMNPDGSEQTRLTYNEIYDESPSWSPDNKKIVFSSITPPSRTLGIHVMDIDGSNRTNLNSSGVQPVWSPDGSKIAFSSSRHGYFSYSVYIMDADGSNQTELAERASNPSWSPDGEKITYSTVSPFTGAIYIMNPDGTEKTLIAEPNDPWRYYDDPAWSPDGTKIAFVKGYSGMPPAPDSADPEIFIIDADGSNQRKLTNNEMSDTQPSWSPDSKKIVFMRNYYNIRVIEIDSGDETSLTDGLMDSEPSWSSYFTEQMIK